MSYPNAAERRRLERFPDRIDVEDLRACFALSDRDRELIYDQRGVDNRLGLAVTVCAVRFLGFVPVELASIPEEALAFVAGQVDTVPHELLAYGTLAQTRSDHLALVLEHLRWRRASNADRDRLARWLGERAVEHDPPAALIALAGEHLRARQILRPSLDTLLRMVRSARVQAHRRIDALLADQLSPARRVQLDALLDTEPGQASELADLRGRAARAGVRELLGQADRYRRLVDLDALRIDVGVLPPARARALEALGRRMTAQQLRRLEPARRYPIVLVTLHALAIERGDELLDLFDKPRSASSSRWRAVRQDHARVRGHRRTAVSTNSSIFAANTASIAGRARSTTGILPASSRNRTQYATVL
jgi:hypothetical protein